MSFLAQKSEFEFPNPSAVGQTLLCCSGLGLLECPCPGVCSWGRVPWCTPTTGGALEPVTSVGQEMTTRFATRIFLHEREFLGRKSQLAQPLILPVATPKEITLIYFLRFILYSAEIS